MAKLIRIGMDTSKSVFQLHGVYEGEEEAPLTKKVRRRDLLAFFAKLEATRIGLEACGASHYWARELRKLGHEVVLIPPQYIKGYVLRGKNDKIDAEAICEAMSRRKLWDRFVPIKSIEQQAGQMMLGVREGLKKRRTQVSNAIRGHASEFGLVVAEGLANLEPLLLQIQDDTTIPELARDLFVMLAGQYLHVDAQLREIEARLTTFYRGNEQCRRLGAIPGLGENCAVALTVKVTDPKRFKSGRDLSAWMGLTPKDHSTAGKHRQGVITKAGDEMLRWLMVSGAMAVIQQAMRFPERASPWVLELLKRKAPIDAAVALANKNARIAHRLMVSGERYDARKAASRAKPADKKAHALKVAA